MRVLLDDHSDGLRRAPNSRGRPKIRSKERNSDDGKGFQCPYTVTGVIANAIDRSVEPLNWITRSVLAGSSNSTILWGRSQLREP